MQAGGETTEGQHSRTRRAALTRTVLFVGVVAGAWLIGGAVAHADAADPAVPIVTSTNADHSIGVTLPIGPLTPVLSTLTAAPDELAPPSAPSPGVGVLPSLDTLPEIGTLPEIETLPGFGVLPDLWGGGHGPPPIDQGPEHVADDIPGEPGPGSTDVVDFGQVDTHPVAVGQVDADGVDTGAEARSLAPAIVVSPLEQPTSGVRDTPTNSPIRTHAAASGPQAPPQGSAPHADSGTGAEPGPADSGTAPGNTGCGSGAPLAVLTSTDGTARPSAGSRVHADATAVARVIAERPAASPD